MIHIACQNPPAGAWNLYPHTEYHRGFPVGPTDTMIDVACAHTYEGPFVVGCVDLETIAASLLLAWRDPSREVLAQAEAISEAYRHDTGLVPWRPGRRGIVHPYVAGIARIAMADTDITLRRAQVYRWLVGKFIPEDWAPPVVSGMTAGPVTLVRGPLWQAWEVSPIGITEEGGYGIHPGARHLWQLRPVRFKRGDGPRVILERVVAKVRQL